MKLPRKGSTEALLIHTCRKPLQKARSSDPWQEPAHEMHGILRCLSMKDSFAGLTVDLCLWLFSVQVDPALVVTENTQGCQNLQVTFLYKLAEGSCPKSYGTNVARLAGLPSPLVTRASLMAATLEKRALEEAEGIGDSVKAFKPLLATFKDLLEGPNGADRDAGLKELQSSAVHVISSSRN